MTKPKVLDIKYGITITRPWNEQMYIHNDVVSNEMKQNIMKALRNRKYTAEELNDMARYITGYTFGDLSNRETIREELIDAVDSLQCWWLAQEYPTLVEKGYCKPTAMDIVGFSK